MPNKKPKIISVKSLSPTEAIKISISPISEAVTLMPSTQEPTISLKSKNTTTTTTDTTVKRKKLISDPDLIALHKGCPIKVSKTKLLEIYTEHPALYTIRLAGIVFGKETLSAVSKESEDHAIDLLDQNILNSLISK